MRRWSVVLAALAVLGAGAAWWWSRAPAGPRLVLVYATCTLNRHFLAPYNDAVTYTPALQRFARDAALFTAHQTEEGQSGIAFASLLSGNQSMRHGIYSHPTRLSDELYLMGEAFRDAGYDTYFWSAHQMASSSLNYGQGIDPAHTFAADLKKVPPDEDSLRADTPQFQQLLRELRDDPDKRAFVLTTFTVTHAPYHHLVLDELCALAPAECDSFGRDEMLRYLLIYWQNFLKLQFDWDATIAALGLTPAEADRLTALLALLYRSQVAYLDRRFGEIVDAIAAAGLLDESLIVFTADHGELIERRAHGMRWTHGFILSEEDIVVPLIIRAPGVRPQRIDAVTRSIDVFPTIAALAGLPLADHVAEGVDLSPALRGETAMPHLLAFSHSSLLPDFMTREKHAAILQHFPRRDPDLMWVAVRDGDRVYKLTDPNGTGFALHVYDWRTDPEERHDLYDPADPAHAAMLKRLGAYKGELVEAYSYWQAVAEGRVPSERQRELLRSLGYID